MALAGDLSRGLRRGSVGSSLCSVAICALATDCAAFGYTGGVALIRYWWLRNEPPTWYAGAWQATLDQFKDSGGIPKIPNFQYHHQPFNYFKQQGPENPAERNKRLRDGGLGDDASTNKFFADAQAGKLPAVTFYKPQGNLNMHAGYADVASACHAPAYQAQSTFFFDSLSPMCSWVCGTSTLGKSGLE